MQTEMCSTSIKLVMFYICCIMLLTVSGFPGEDLDRSGLEMPAVYLDNDSYSSAVSSGEGPTATADDLPPEHQPPSLMNDTLDHPPPPQVLIPPVYISHMETPSKTVLNLGVNLSLGYNLTVRQNDSYAEVSIFKEEESEDLPEKEKNMSGIK